MITLVLVNKFFINKIHLDFKMNKKNNLNLRKNNSNNRIKLKFKRSNQASLKGWLLNQWIKSRALNKKCILTN